MKLGSIEFHILNDGTFRLDGGAMFGVIPKPMWERVVPHDDRNAARGLEPEQIDIVVNTHLHFDHCGWNTRIVNRQAVPTFPNARYFVHRGELEHARHPSERDRVSYLADNFEPMAQSGQWQLVEDEHCEIVPGVELIVLAGHTNDMMGVRLSSGGHTAMFLSDLVPMTAHLPLPWIMGFDSYPLTTLANKKKWLPQIVREGWLALFCHDGKTPAARLREQDGKIVAEPVVVD